MLAIRSSIQLKILLLLLGLALPPLLLVGWTGLAGLDQAKTSAVVEGTAALRTEAERVLALRALDKARLYDQALAGIQQQVEAIAAFAETRYGQPPPPATADRVWVAPRPSPALLERFRDDVAFAQQLTPLLRSSVGANKLVSLGYVALDQGGVIAFDTPAVIDTLLEYPAFDPRSRPWYTQARSARATIWTAAYVDANTGLLATTCATPIYDSNDRFIGVVAFDLLLSTIQQDLLTVDIGRTGYAFMVNQLGDVIVRPDMPAENLAWNQPFRTERLPDSPSAGLRAVAARMRSREAGVSQIVDSARPAYIAYAPIATAGWSVALVIPADEVVAPAVATGQQLALSQERLRRQLTITLAVVVAAIGALGVLLSLSFTRRIRALQAGVTAVAGGDLRQRLPAAGQDEIGQLVDAFNTMTATLQAKVVELEENAEQLATVNAVSNELKRLLDLPRLYQVIAEAVCERFGFDRAALYIVDGRYLRVAGASFGSGKEQEARHFAEVVNANLLRLDGPTVEADVVRSGKAVIVDDPWNHPRVDQSKQRADGGNSYVQVPIFGRSGDVIGLLGADYARTDRPIAAEDASRLLMFANMVGLTIENVRLYSDLERQVAQRTEQLRAALDQAQLADRRKSDFLASVSHELRTPLNAIIGFSTVLLDGIDGPLSPPQREDVQSINRNGRFLLHLINELLDLAKIEAGHLTLNVAPVSLAALAGEVADTVQALLHDPAVALHCALPDDLPLVLADADRVRQILLNLLSNAAKFTERGSITVGAYLLDEVREDGQVAPAVAITVADTGVGIPPERQHDVFTEFVQLHNGRLRARGTGLGLAIVRKLVEAQAGRVWVDSQPGAGSTFTFTLPAIARPAPVGRANGANGAHTGHSLAAAVAARLKADARRERA